jgi:hypothetical protein
MDCHLEGYYPFVIAPTGSCASPKSSPRLRSHYSAWSVQVAASPCWKRDLPDVISASLSLDAWTCIPPACESAPTRFFLPQHRPSPPGTWVGLAGNARSATSERPRVSRRQSFRNVQASKFACHSGRSYRCDTMSARQPWRLHPRRTHVVTFMRIGYASRPNRAIDDRGLPPH